jgi:molecular chaperone GrpE
MANAKKEETQHDIADDLEGFAEGEAEFDGLALDEAFGIEDEIAALKAERDEMRDRFMRALADAENTRKRGERDRREAEMYGGTKLARDMLPVYDSLQRALESMSDEQKQKDKALIEGLELTMRELLNVFKKHGIEALVPMAGDTFDPQLHQAMFEAPVPGTKAGEIIQVMTAGFMIHDRLLRPAQVGVSSTPAS